MSQFITIDGSLNANGFNLLDVLEDEGERPDAHAVRSDGIAILKARMGKLPKMQRALVRGALAGMSSEQLAIMLNAPAEKITTWMALAIAGVTGPAQRESKRVERLHTGVLSVTRKNYRNISQGLTCHGTPRLTERKGAPRQYDYDAVRKFYTEHQCRKATQAEFGMSFSVLHRILTIKPRTEPYRLRRNVKARLGLLEAAGIMLDDDRNSVREIV